MRLASACSWTTTSAQANSRAHRNPSPSGASSELKVSPANAGVQRGNDDSPPLETRTLAPSPGGALAPPLLRIEQQRPVDLHAIAVCKRRVGAHALAVDAKRAQIGIRMPCRDARGGECITHGSARG